MGSTALYSRSRWEIQRKLVTTVKFPEGQVEVVHVSTIGLKPWGGLLTCLNARLEAVKLANAWKPDVVFSYNCILAEAIMIVALKRKFRIPAIVEIDDYPGSRSRGLNPKASLDLWGWRQTEPIVSGFVLVNSALCSEFAIGQRPSIIIPGIVDELLLNSVKNRQKPFCGRDRTLVYCGGLSKERGADRLLAAIPNLPGNWRLIVSGSGPLANDFDQLGRMYPLKCTYQGFVSVEQMYATLCSANVVINTPENLINTNGVFPFKILEYIVSGAHIISTSLPSVGGISLKWFQRWNGDDQQLGRLLQQSENDYFVETSLRSAAIQWVEEHFSLHEVSTKLEQLFRAVASKGTETISNIMNE